MAAVVRVPELRKLAGQIDEQHSKCREAMMRGIEHALKAGELLTDAKALVPHGQWLLWLQDNCEVSQRTAQLYMQLYSRRDELGETATVADLTVRGATALLAIPCENPSKGEAREPDGKDSDLIDLEALIDEGDRRASQARLKFGLELFQCRTTRGKFPAAFLDRVCEATGKSRQEIDYRLHLAEKYMERLSTDLAAVTTDA